MSGDNFDKYACRIGVPLGKINEGEAVTMGLGRFPSGATVNGYQIFAPDEIGFINHIVKSGRKKYDSEQLNFSVIQCDKYYDLNVDGLKKDDE